MLRGSKVGGIKPFGAVGSLLAVYGAALLHSEPKAGVSDSKCAALHG